MLNLFINSTTYGQAMGATFNMTAEGSLAQKRLTSFEDSKVQEPGYEKTLSPEYVSNLIATGQTKKVSSLGKAVETENIRVNSLAMLIRELSFVNTVEDNSTIIAYLPASLLTELESGRIKFYIGEDATETTYYSAEELNLWKVAMPLIQSLYHRLVFKNIESCKTNISKSEIQGLRVTINAGMNSRLLEAFRTMRASKSVKPQTVNAQVEEDLFG